MVRRLLLLKLGRIRSGGGKLSRMGILVRRRGKD